MSMLKEHYSLIVRRGEMTILPYGERLASYVHDLKFKSLPSGVVDFTKNLLLDFLGVAIAGSVTPWGRIIMETTKSIDGKKESTIIASNFRSHCTNAAFANGTFGHSLDFDDNHNEAGIHPGVVVIPASLALGERERAEGRDLIASMVAGYEVILRVGSALNYLNHMKRGFHPTGTTGTFGAAAASGKILKLNADQVADAFGIAGSCSSGLLEFFATGSPTKRLHAGKSARDGILSSILAQRGFAGPHSVFEGRNGFLRAYSDSTVPERLTEGLGEEYRILTTHIKKYACNACYHTGLDGLSNIMADHHLKPNDLAEVNVGVSNLVLLNQSQSNYEPRTVLDAQMSYPFCLSMVAHEGCLTHREFRHKNLKDPHVRSLMQKIKIVQDEEAEKAWQNDPTTFVAILNVKSRDGGTYTDRVDYFKGHPRNPMTKGDIEEKFSRCASPLIKTTTRIIEKIDRLEKISVPDLMKMTRL